MENNKKISVIVPIYNTGMRLLGCVDSVLNQTQKDFELILVDDGSDEETAQLCEQLKDKDERIIVYHQDNGGVSDARNLGIAKAGGKWLYFMDSDDYIDSDMLETMALAAENKNADLAVCGYYDEIIGKPEKAAQNVHSYQFICGKAEIKENLIALWDSSLMYNVWNKLFLKEKVEEHRILFSKGKAFNEDRDFVRSYLLYVENILVLDKCFYHYIREVQFSAAGQYRPDKLEIRKAEYLDLKKFFKEMGIVSEEAKEYVAREHFERVIGYVEELFHYKALTIRKRYLEIKKCLKDKDTIEVRKLARPKSGMMKVIYAVYKLNNAALVYFMTDCIYMIRSTCPDLFYRLRSRR